MCEHAYLNSAPVSYKKYELTDYFIYQITVMIILDVFLRC
jgi:hypothetical protein